MPLNPATTDAFRNIAVVEGSFPEATTTTVAAEIVGDTLTITGGFGITITADPLTDSIVINNTGDAVGAYTEITEANADETYYPVFSRPLDETPFNTNPVTGEHQLDTLYIDFTTTPMSYNPSTSTLTASIFSGNLTGNVTGDVSGNAGTVTNGVYTSGSYSDPSWLTISSTKVGLGNVTNESKATMFSSPTFTGTVSGVTATMVGLGNVTNESKVTMFTTPIFTSNGTTVHTRVIPGGDLEIAQNGLTLGTVDSTSGLRLSWRESSGQQAYIDGIGSVVGSPAGTGTNGLGFHLDATDSNYAMTMTQDKGFVFRRASIESMAPNGGVSGVTTHDLKSSAGVFYQFEPADNFTPNFTNVPISVLGTISVAVIVVQGATAYMPTAVQINGTAETILWQGGAVPSGTVNGVDVVSFTFIRTGNLTGDGSAGVWTVIAGSKSYL